MIQTFLLIIHVRQLSHVIPVTKGTKKVIPLSNIVTKCVFLSYKEPDLGEAAFVA